jgi:hypothetical protein
LADFGTRSCALRLVDNKSNKLATISGILEVFIFASSGALVFRLDNNEGAFLTRKISVQRKYA